MTANLRRYIVCSTGKVNLSEPSQRRWLLKQTLSHNRMEDIHALDLQEARYELENQTSYPTCAVCGSDSWEHVGFQGCAERGVEARKVHHPPQN